VTAVFDIVNPATEEIVTTVEETSLEQTDAAIERAAAAFPAWRAVAPGDRGRLLRRFAEAVDEHLEELAQLEVANSGHPIGNARWEAGNVRDVLTYYSAAPERAIEAGNLSVNSNASVRYWTPFGGLKQSGLDRELGPDALDSFTDVKNVFLATD
jgi:acyl-CoA reductase-like NAD-dependent aldehyde dehydrogenase